MIFIYTTCASKKEAKKLSKLIINKKMGVCVDYWRVNSMYNWENEIKQISQIMILITTLESKLEDINEVISNNHGYSIPLIAGLDVRRINRSYKEWMASELI